MRFSICLQTIIVTCVLAATVNGDEKPKWQTLFDGKSLTGWKSIEKKDTDFEKHGKVFVKDGSMILEAGKPSTGVRWVGAPLPKTDYELTLEGKRVAGDDFFCGLTFPVGDSGLTLILGGWSGWVVGLSCIDGLYALNNETCQKVEFEQNRWYRVRVRVTKPKVEVWLDGKKIIDLAKENHKFAVSEEMELCEELGVATWRTTGAIRAVRIRDLP